MDRSKDNGPDSAPAYTLTRRELRDLVRQEVQAAVAQSMGNATTGTRKPFFSVKEASTYSGLGKSTIRLYIRKGRLKTGRVGRRVIIAASDLDAFMCANPKWT